eukprot:TRINITY_DN3535_c0_g1_i2.p1 TRINITY_DN3535_c0_g1~~TRINITY_DN3535_c0_g1_i2.p1  ORF type:complete len:416 (-),score=109.45 TRINITY_DN3535_c0_g1_i2:31-1278(-)
MMKNVYKEAIQREDGIEMVEQVLNEIVQKAGDIVYKHHMQRRVVPYAVQRMKSDIITIIDWMFISHDVGEKVNTAPNEQTIVDSSDLSWVEDSEPSPCPIDTCAKSALTIIPVVTNILPPDPLENSEVASIAPSNTTNRRKLKVKAKSVEEGSSLNNSESPPPLITSPSAMSLQRQKPPQKNTTNAQNSQKEDSQKSRISHVYPFASTQTKRQPTKNEIEQEQAEKFEKLRRELKGKEYSYDHNGNVVLVNNVDADKPNKEKVVPVKISIADDGPSTQNEEADSSKPSKPRTTSANKNSKPKKSDYVKETRPPQPSAFENIKLAPGVTLRDGNKIKEGAPISTLLQQNTTPNNIPTLSNFGKKMPAILTSLTPTPQQTQSPSPPILAWVDDSEKISLPNIKIMNNKIEARSSTES